MDLDFKPTRTLIREGEEQRRALTELIAAARGYTYAREAAPIGDWQARIEDAGWQLAQTVRAYDKF